MLSTETAKTSTVADFTSTDPLVSQMPNVALALHVLAEVGRGDKSQWAAYLATLPQDYSTPLYALPRPRHCYRVLGDKPLLYSLPQLSGVHPHLFPTASPWTSALCGLPWFVALVWCARLLWMRRGEFEVLSAVIVTVPSLPH
jgi:hypothetical protein